MATSDHSRALNPAGQHERSSWQSGSRTTDGLSGIDRVAGELVGAVPQGGSRCEPGVQCPAPRRGVVVGGHRPGHQRRSRGHGQQPSASRGGCGRSLRPGPVARPRQLKRDNSVHHHRPGRPDDHACRSWHALHAAEDFTGLQLTSLDLIGCSWRLCAGSGIGLRWPRSGRAEGRARGVAAVLRRLPLARRPGRLPQRASGSRTRWTIISSRVPRARSSHGGTLPQSESRCAVQ